MIKRRSLLAAGGAAMAAGGLARPSLAQGAKVLKYVPQANLANPDPIWTTATVATIHGYMVWDTLYGIDAGLIARPQMVAGHQVSSDGKTWRLTLREGLFWHDGPPVRSADCIPSIQRWGKRDPLGQKLMSLVTAMKVVDDKNFEISLSKPFSLLPYVLGAAGCFIMPERIAKTDAFKQIGEFIGSGPFRFLKNEWVSGSSAAYAKFDKYTPRSEAPSYWAGGKVANFDRVEWRIIPDPATAAAALQTGEVDWVEQPLIDLLPTLRKSPDVVVEVLDPLGALGIIAFNHTLPPFNNPKMLQAVLHAVDQKEYVQAVVGAQPQLGREPVGFFTAGSPYANNVGIEALTSPRDLTLAKKLVAESGYKGEKVVLMSPSDQPQLQIMAQVTADLYKKLGLNVDYQSMDWGTLVSRRASKKPIDQGGWNSFCTTWGGLQVSNPGSSFPLRGNGGAGWFGWPNDPKMEALREQWFDAPDLKAQQAITGEMQALAFKDVPFVPVGQWFTPTAHRKNLVDFVKSGTISFWSVKRV